MKMIKEYSPIKKKLGIKNFLSLSPSQNARTCLCISSTDFQTQSLPSRIQNFNGSNSVAAFTAYILTGYNDRTLKITVEVVMIHRGRSKRTVILRINGWKRLIFPINNVIDRQYNALHRNSMHLLWNSHQNLDYNETRQSWTSLMIQSLPL